MERTHVEYVHLVRHALPVALLRVDRPDPALSTFGHSQAEALAAWWAGRPTAGVVISDMLRAQQTAAPLLATLDVQPITVRDLAEIDVGADFYLPITDNFLVGEHVELAWWRRRILDPDMVQAREEFQRRAVTAFERATEVESDHALLVFTHGGVIAALTRWALGIPALDGGLDADYASVTTLRRKPAGGWTVVSFSETQHLAHLGTPKQVDGVSLEE